jgi:hypothetical protein
MTFIARGAHLGAIRERGLTVKSRFVGDFTVTTSASTPAASSRVRASAVRRAWTSASKA